MSSGTLTQKVKITVDISDILNFIVDNIIEGIEEQAGNFNDEQYYVEGDDLIIEGEYETDIAIHSSPATWDDPGYYEEERELEKLDKKELEKFIRDKIKNININEFADTVIIDEVDEYEESVEIYDHEPDDYEIPFDDDYDD